MTNRIILPRLTTMGHLVITLNGVAGYEQNFNDVSRLTRIDIGVDINTSTIRVLTRLSDTVLSANAIGKKLH